MPTPSKDSRPSAGRTAKFEAPVPPLNVPVVRSRITLVVLRGSISSYTLPPLVPPPFSSVNTIVPHGVRLAASQKIVPLTMVCTAPVAMLIRWSPGSASTCSLQAISHSGSWSFCHRASMSMTGAATPLVTTRALRLCANVAKDVGSAFAWAAVTDDVDDAGIGPWTPNSWTERPRSRLSRSTPKSVPATATAATSPMTRLAAASSRMVFFMKASLRLGAITCSLPSQFYARTIYRRKLSSCWQVSEHRPDPRRTFMNGRPSRPRLVAADTAARSSGGSAKRPVAPTSITCICWPSPARRPCRCTDGSGSRRSGTSPAPSARHERLGAAVVRTEPGFVQVQVPEQPIDEEGRGRLVALSEVGEAHLAHAEQHGTCGPALGAVEGAGFDVRIHGCIDRPSTWSEVERRANEGRTLRDRSGYRQPVTSSTTPWPLTLCCTLTKKRVPVASKIPPVHSAPSPAFAVRSFSVPIRIQPSETPSMSAPSGRQSHRSLFLCVAPMSPSSCRIQFPRPGWYAMLSGIARSELPITKNCTSGVAAFVAAWASVPSVMQMLSPQL